MTNVKFNAFGKVKFRDKSSVSSKLIKLQEEKVNCNDSERLKDLNNKIAEELENGRKEALEKDLKILNDLKNKKGKIAAMFNLRETLVGNKKVGQEATILIDPTTKSEVNTVDGIKQVSLQYCKELLCNRVPRDGYGDIIEEKYKLHEIRMNENVTDDIVLTEVMFYEALQRLKYKHAQKYKFILKGGNALKNALFRLYKEIWESEKIPTLWKKTQIIQLYKGKGNPHELSNYRNIHTKCDTRKLFGEIITHELKQKVIENVSKFQIGAIEGHRSQEHLFTVKNVISHYNSHIVFI